MKRFLENEEIPHITKKSKGIEDKSRLDNFVSWCCEHGMEINSKVKACWGDPCAQYGMVSTDEISGGECLFEIPRSILLSPTTCGIADLLQKESKALSSESGWIPQLLSLMYESCNPNSKWKPYLTLFPDYEELDLPMFWTKDERDRELMGTGVSDSAEKDLISLEKEFNSIVLPFVKKHSDVFTDDRCRDLKFYQKMVAFIMSYSFTEPITAARDEEDSDEEEDELESEKSPPMMVPMADILNHVANNNAHLDFGKESLKMVAVRDIAKGEEIYNTYGELSNFQLLHMYGFAEAYPTNYYDTVELPMIKVYSYLNGSELVDATFPDRWQALIKNHIITEGGAFVVGEEGILTEEEMLEMLKVLTMSNDTFEEYRKADDWMEDDEDDISLVKDDIKWLPEKWRNIIKHLTTCALGEYGDRSIQSEEDNLNSTKWTTLSRKEQYCVYVRYGQLKLLHSLKEACLQNEETSKKNS